MSGGEPDWQPCRCCGSLPPGATRADWSRDVHCKECGARALVGFGAMGCPVDGQGAQEGPPSCRSCDGLFSATEPPQRAVVLDPDGERYRVICKACGADVDRREPLKPSYEFLFCAELALYKRIDFYRKGGRLPPMEVVRAHEEAKLLLEDVRRREREQRKEGA